MPELSMTAILAQLFTGLVLGGILVLLAIGLSLIFGLMGVVNFAHGSLYMLGAYFGFFLWGLTKSYWAALVIAPLTVGLSLVLVEAVKLIWGKIGLTLDPPAQLAGAVDLGFMKFPAFRLFVIALTALVLVGLWLFLEKTNIGLIVRAGARDPLMVRALGINLGRVWLQVFGLGIAMAGLAGILAGPLRGVYAEMGVEIIIECFVVVVVGGMGSLMGAVVAGLLIGEVVSLTSFFAPKLAEIVVFLVMALVLLLRPSGLFGEPGLAE